MRSLAEIREQLLLLGFLAEELESIGSHFFTHDAVLLENLWLYWMPLAQEIFKLHRRLNRPVIQGLLGGQGTGKSTLTKILQIILTKRGLRVYSLSLDDLYKTYAERQTLRQLNPLLIWRGPPGTHDVDLGLKIFDQFLGQQASTPIRVPVFDKYAVTGQGDRAGFEAIETPLDVLIFEGWCVGVHPIPDQRFDHPPAPIDSECDRQFARDMNAAIAAYVPLWERLDALWVLNPIDYRLSLGWRQEAESEAIASGKTGMSPSEIQRFVEYFWKALHPQLFIQPLTEPNPWVDWVIEIGADHAFQRIYSPDKFTR